LDTSAPAKKFETLRHQTHGAEMSWVRSVLGPKCPYTAKLHLMLRPYYILTLTLPLDLKSPMTLKLNHDGHVGRI